MNAGGKMFAKIRDFLIIYFALLFITPAVYGNFKPLQLRVDSLKNGLKIIYIADNSINFFSSVMIYNIGSRDEDSTYKGIVSLLAYYMNSQTENIPFGELERLIFETGGQFNTKVQNDYIMFHSTVPAPDFKLPLWIESERMRKVKFTQENFGNLTKYAYNNLLLSKRNTLINPKLNDVLENIFHHTEYSHQPYDISEQTLAVDATTLQSLYDKYIQPNNATLVISGKFDINETLKTINEYFSQYNKQETPKRVDTLLSIQLEPVRIIKSIPNTEIPSIYIGFLTPTVKESDYHSFALLNNVISKIPNSRFRKIFENNGEYNAIEIPLVNTAVTIYSLSSEKLPLEKAEELMIAELREIASNGITESELDEAKNYIEHNYYENIADYDKLAQQLAWFHNLYKNSYLINSTLDKYLKLTLSEVNKVANKYLYTNDYVTFIYQP